MEQAYTHAGYKLEDLQTTAYQYWDLEYACENNNLIIKDKELEESPWDMTFEKCENHYCGCGLKIIKENIIPYFVHVCP